jgi:hypothetical protein
VSGDEHLTVPAPEELGTGEVGPEATS